MLIGGSHVYSILNIPLLSDTSNSIKSAYNMMDGIIRAKKKNAMSYYV